MVGEIGVKTFNTQMQELIEKAVDIGIHTFDHADIYGDIRQRKVLEKLLKSSLPRKKSSFRLNVYTTSM